MRLAVLLLLLLAPGCASRFAPFGEEPLRLSELDGAGDNRGVPGRDWGGGGGLGGVDRGRDGLGGSALGGVGFWAFWTL